MASSDLLLSLLCVLVTGLSKLPQIHSLSRALNVGGFSITGLHLALFSNCLMTGFYVAESYPILLYLEYPLLILQELILLYLVGLLSSSPSLALRYITAYITLVFLISTGLLSKALVLSVLSLNIPLGLSSKAVQVQAIWQEGSSQGVSSLPFLVNVSTRLARLHTTITSGVALEPLIITNSLLQLSANVGVLVVIQMFSRDKLKSS